MIHVWHNLAAVHSCQMVLQIRLQVPEAITAVHGANCALATVGGEYPTLTAFASLVAMPSADWT